MLHSFLKDSAGLGKIILGVFLIGLVGCNSGDKQPGVPNIPVELTVHRFDQAVAAIDTNRLAEDVDELYNKYPDFLPFYVARLLPFAVNDPSMEPSQHMQQAIGYLLTDKDYRGVFDTLQAHFPDVEPINQELVKGFKYLKHYLPEYEVPEVVYFASGLNSWTAITYEDDRKFLGIGLDMFFGENYPFYVSVGVPQYMTQRLLPASIPAHAFRAIYEDLVPFTAEEKTLLDMMIQRGKAQYFLSKVIPFVPDTIRFGYTGAQLKWCEENEAMVYNFFIRENLLYETNWQKTLRYVNDGPTSTGMPIESPGNIGSWLGYRIVSDYMKRHPELSLAELLVLDDGQKILQEAKYKPR